jgi:hypothetical protein
LEATSALYSWSERRDSREFHGHSLEVEVDVQPPYLDDALGQINAMRVKEGRISWDVISATIFGISLMAAASKRAGWARKRRLKSALATFWLFEPVEIRRD